MQRADVTVIIPFFNGSKTVERALESVFQQSVSPRQVIVVDDGSKPKEAAYLADLQAKFGFDLITQANAGQSAARNAAARLAKTRWISLLDQDDYFLPNHIDRLLNFAATIDSKNLGFVYSDLARVSPRGEVLLESVVESYRQAAALDSIASMVAGDMYVLPSAALIDRNAFLSVDGFDEALIGYEDDDLFLRLTMAGFEHAYLPEVLTHWTLNLQSASFSPAMATSRLRYFEKLVSALPDDFDGTPYLRRYLIPRFVSSFVSEYLAAIATHRHQIQLKRSELQWALKAARHSGSSYIGATYVVAIALVTVSPKLVLFAGRCAKYAGALALLKALNRIRKSKARQSASLG